MKDNNTIVVIIGLVLIMAIVVWVAHWDYVYLGLLTKTSDALNSVLLQQKDIMIKKLVKQLEAKQGELDEAQRALSGLQEKMHTFEKATATSK